MGVKIGSGTFFMIFSGFWEDSVQFVCLVHILLGKDWCLRYVLGGLPLDLMEVFYVIEAGNFSRTFFCFFCF